MRELPSQPRLIVALFGPTTPTTPQQIRDMEAAARTVGQSILVLQARDEEEVATAFATMAERQANGLVYGASVYFQVVAAKLVALAARYRLPALTSARIRRGRRANELQHEPWRIRSE